MSTNVITINYSIIPDINIESMRIRVVPVRVVDRSGVFPVESSLKYN